jgi:hypothetical protein
LLRDLKGINLMILEIINTSIKLIIDIMKPVNIEIPVSIKLFIINLKQRDLAGSFKYNSCGCFLEQ